MAFLTITGYGTLEVYSEGAAEEAPEDGGEDTRSHAGTLITTVLYTKRTWTFETAWLTQAEYNTLKSVTGNGAHLVCSGDAIDNANVVCRVKHHGGVYVDNGTLTSFLRIARISLIEV